MSETVLGELLQVLGEKIVMHGDSIDERYRVDRLGRSGCTPLAVVRPNSTQTLAQTLEVCNRHRQPVVIQGGMTGLVAGAQARDTDVVLSLENMAGIEEIDVDAATMTVLAGTPLQVVQQAAQAQNLYFAVDLGARGSCQIGGNIATNAGGNRVIRYGMMREQVLGLETVLADGTVISSMNKMLKNNAGYDLKQMFIGSEGTLGVITRAVLRLHPLPGQTFSALCVLSDYAAVVAFLRRAKQTCNAALLAFEVMWPDFYRFMTQEVAGNVCPVQITNQMVVLLECDAGSGGLTLEQFEEFVADALQAGEIEDAALAITLAQAQAFWRIRDSVSEFPRLFSPYGSFDVSLPIGSIGKYAENLRRQLAQHVPEARSLFFGHIGDSNLHVVVHVPGEAALYPRQQIDTIVYELVAEYQGSVSAEHGIGTLKKPWLRHTRNDNEIALMHRLKQMLDPNAILNRGSVLTD